MKLFWSKNSLLDNLLALGFKKAKILYTIVKSFSFGLFFSITSVFLHHTRVILDKLLLQKN
jgi:hypothetical protein